MAILGDPGPQCRKCSFTACDGFGKTSNVPTRCWAKARSTWHYLSSLLGNVAPDSLWALYCETQLCSSLDTLSTVLSIYSYNATRWHNWYACLIHEKTSFQFLLNAIPIAFWSALVEAPIAICRNTMNRLTCVSIAHSDLCVSSIHCI